MAEIEFAFKKHYSSFFSTFKQTSLDDNDKNTKNEYLCQDESQKVIAFDSILKDKYPNSYDRPQSFDAIYLKNKDVYLIEFKNEKKPKNATLSGKLVDGKNELDIILGEINVKKSNYNFIYCVVYNKCKNSVNRYKCGLKQEEYKISLKKYKDNGLINDIYTENVSFFTTLFKKNFKKELKC